MTLMADAKSFSFANKVIRYHITYIFSLLHYSIVYPYIVIPYEYAYCTLYVQEYIECNTEYNSGVKMDETSFDLMPFSQSLQLMH